MDVFLKMYSLVFGSRKDNQIRQEAYENIEYCWEMLLNCLAKVPFFAPLLVKYKLVDRRVLRKSTREV